MALADPTQQRAALDGALAQLRTSQYWFAINIAEPPRLRRFEQLFGMAGGARAADARVQPRLGGVGAQRPSGGAGTGRGRRQCEDIRTLIRLLGPQLVPTDELGSSPAAQAASRSGLPPARLGGGLPPGSAAPAGSPPVAADRPPLGTAHDQRHPDANSPPPTDLPQRQALDLQPQCPLPLLHLTCGRIRNVLQAAPGRP